MMAIRTECLKGVDVFRRKSMMVALAIMCLATSCQRQDDLSLCPNLSEVGKGNKLFEEARRCVRVMAARYSISGESPDDISTAAIDFCHDRKIEPIVADVNDIVMRNKLLREIEGDMRNAAIHTVVEMRTGKCITEKGVFEGINDPINRP
jgi:hypothetical protein